MPRETSETVELIDLGVASTETQGSDYISVDGAGQLPQFGLSDD